MTALPWVFDDGGRSVAGFRGLTGDCVTRSIAIATGLDYQVVYDKIIDIAAGERKSKRERRPSHPRTGVHKRTYRKLLADLGWTFTPTMFIGSGCTVHLAVDEIPMTGRLIVNVSKHLVTVIDGVAHDTHDPARNGTRCVYGYYQQPNSP